MIERTESPAQPEPDAEVPPRVETRIAAVLRGGVLVAGTLLAIGLPWVIAREPADVSDGPSVGEALRNLGSLDPLALAGLGVVALVATPILQLITSAILFRRARDRTYLALTLTVCAIVAVGATVAGGAG